MIEVNVYQQHKESVLHANQNYVNFQNYRKNTPVRNTVI